MSPPAMRKQSLLEGALVLTVAGLAARALGAVYRIILPRFIGAEAIGLFQMAYPVYNVFLIVSISGLPLAISKLLAEELALGRGRSARRTLRLAFALVFALGLGATLALYSGAGWLARGLLGDPGAEPVIRAVAPSVFFLALISGWRGLFQGLQNMVPSGVAQVAEQLVRVLGTLGLALWLRPFGVEAAAAGAAGGAVVGSIVGLAVLLWYHWRYRESIGFRLGNTPSRAAARGLPSSRAILRRILALSIPIVIGALIIPLTQSLDAALVPRRLLDLGFSVELARVEYGRLAGMAMVLAYFPASLLVGVAVAIVPVLSELQAVHRDNLMRDRIDEALWVTTAVGLPAAMGLWVLATPISGLLFADPAAGAPLAAMAPAALLIAVHGTTVGILQGLGRVADPVRYLFWGAVVKVAFTWWLTSYPALAVSGAAYATVLSFLVAVGGNLWAIRRATGYQVHWSRTILRPVVATLLMAGAAQAAHTGLLAASLAVRGLPSHSLATLGAVGTGALVYAAALHLLGAVPPGLLKMVRA